MATFNLTCPKCKAPPETARLEVVSMKLEAIHIMLEEDGFDITTGDQMCTEDEMVWCRACKETFPLDECQIWKEEACPTESE